MSQVVVSAMKTEYGVLNQQTQTSVLFHDLIVLDLTPSTFPNLGAQQNSPLNPLAYTTCYNGALPQIIGPNHRIATGGFGRVPNLQAYEVDFTKPFSNSTVSILSSETGFFDQREDLDVGGVPIAAVAYDLNDDCETDLAVVSKWKGLVQIFSGRGGNRLPTADFDLSDTPNVTPIAVASGDLDEQTPRHDDLVIVESDGMNQNEVSVLWNDGVASFSKTSLGDVGGDPIDVIIDRIDPNNVYRDIAILNKTTNKIAVFLSGDTPLDLTDPSSQVEIFDTVGFPSAIRVADLDKNRPGKEIIVVQSYEGLTVPAGAGIGIHYYDPSSTPHYSMDPNHYVIIPLAEPNQPNPAYPEPIDLQLADFDNDQRLDIVTANRATQDIRFFRNVDGTAFEWSGKHDLGLADIKAIVVGSFNPYDHSYYRPDFGVSVWFNEI